MSMVGKEDYQPDSFEFAPATMEMAQVEIAKYPVIRKASAVMPLLDLAQRQYPRTSHPTWAVSESCRR